MVPRSWFTVQYSLAIDREHGSKVIGEVTLDQVYGGARGIKSLVWEVRDSKAQIQSRLLLSCWTGFRA